MTGADTAQTDHATEQVGAILDGARDALELAASERAAAFEEAHRRLSEMLDHGLIDHLELEDLT